MPIHLKRTVCVIVLLLLAGLHTASAQPDSTRASALAGFGIKGGPVLSGYEGDDYRPYLGYEVEWVQDDAGSPDVGFQLGLFYTRRLSGHLAVQPELNLVRRGLVFYQTKRYDTSYHLTAYYLQVPVLLKYRLFLAGPYAAIHLGAQRTVDAWGERDTKRLSCMRRVDYGLVFAVSPSFPAGSGRLIVEARFDLGLANAMTTPDGFTGLYEGANPARIRAFTLMTGFMF